MPRRPIIILSLACLIIAVAIGLMTVFVVNGRHAADLSRSEVTSGQPLIGGDFTLVNQDGETVDQSLLEGKWSLVFFGFTYCPDYCPTTLAVLDRVQQETGLSPEELQIVFVTIDPERDTPQMLKDYLSSEGFPKGVIGLTGTPEQIKQAAAAYRVYYAKSGEGEAYTMNHSLTVFLMGPDGQFRSALNHDLGPDRAAKLITDYMQRG